MGPVTLSALIRAPKVILHDHLDGGLRPGTVVELADETGHRLPSDDPGTLAAWFGRNAARRDLGRYLETFEHTVAVLQRADALVRVARECAEAGVEYVELAIGIDGITVATSPNNTAVTCLDIPALYALVGPESEGFSKWSDANALATELGSTAGQLPDAPLTITGPGPESGTYDSFVEFAIKGIASEREKDTAARTDYTQSANDNLIVEGIEGSDTSLEIGRAHV